jgi:hypothetical protein
VSTVSDAMSVSAPTHQPRSRWRAVAVPDEHGGWGLTAEPALLGLLVAPSWAGGALAAAALVAFLARTPLKVVLVDRWRRRRLPRTSLAAQVAAAEIAALAGLAAVAGVRAGWAWLVPVAVALPLVAIELWFDMRSRSRRLVPELCGAVGMAGAAAAVAVAGGASATLAAGLWLVLAARSVASLPFARAQDLRLRRARSAADAPDTTVSARRSDRVTAATAPPADAPDRPTAAVAPTLDAADRARVQVDRAQAAGAGMALAAAALAPEAAAGTVFVVALTALQAGWARRPPVPARTLGFRQLFLGLALVLVTAAGVGLA